jgi:hypothetical protein
MARQLAKRNHYNPCFWTALWNEQFFADYCGGTPNRTRARHQTVLTLNLRSNKIFTTSVENVRYDKDLGVAEITVPSMLRFSRRYYPDHYEELRQYVAEHPESLYLDFEATLTGVEQTDGYDALMRAAKIGGIASTPHKGFLACLLVLHITRSHELMTSILTTPGGIEKWEYFWLLKNAWANHLVLARAVTPLALGAWTLWRTTEHHFPLPDSPVMIDKHSVLAILSPRLLLEIDLNTPQPQEQ